MTSPAEHAATVRAHLKGNGGYLPQHEPMLALDALEAALVELTHQRSVATEWAAELAGKHRAAQARADELERERDEAERLYDDAEQRLTAMEQRAERVEAALREIVDIPDPSDVYVSKRHDDLRTLKDVVQTARAALGGRP